MGCEQREDGYEHFSETTAFQRYGVKTSEKANVRSIALAGYIARTCHVKHICKSILAICMAMQA